MTMNGTARLDMDRRRRTLGGRSRLTKADRTRRIDRIIDYFGGAGARTRSDHVPERPVSLDEPLRQALPVFRLASAVGRQPHTPPPFRVVTDGPFIETKEL